jgi:hypothetical protein
LKKSTFGIGQPRKYTKEEYYETDYIKNYEFAKLCKENGVKHFSLLSSVGSNSSSKNYYIQIKGKLEESIKELNFERTSIIKPSLIVSREVRLIINKLIYRYGLQDRIIRF